jgi:site-specific recombinase XerD
MLNFPNEIKNYSAASRLSETTLKNYTGALVEFNAYLADNLKCKPSDIRLDRIYTIKAKTKVVGYKPIDTKAIDSYLFDHLGETFSQLSIKTHALRSFFKFLKNNRNFPDVISHSEFKLSNYKPKSEPIRILSRHEFLRFLHSMVTHSDDLVRDTLLFGLLFSTGCRISEILNITSSNLNLTDEMVLLLKTKTKVQRVIVLREGFGEVIKEYIQKYRVNDAQLLFPGKDISQPMKRSDAHKLFKSYLNKANLPPMNIHSSRHSFATFMKDEGIDLFTLMELLGHEKLQSTLHYTRHYTRNQKIKIKQHDEVYSHLRKVLKN